MNRVLFSRLTVFSLVMAAVMIVTVFGDRAHAGTTAPTLALQGRLQRPTGVAVDGKSVQFRVQILTPQAEPCVLYEETLLRDLSRTNGVFNFSLNDGTGTRNDDNSHSFAAVFANKAPFNLSGELCSSGQNTVYTPIDSDERYILISFKDETMTEWENLPVATLAHTAYAIDAMRVGGYTPSSLLRVEDASGPQSVSSLTLQNYTDMVSLINGTSSKYMTISSGNAAKLPVVAGAPSSPIAGSIWLDSQSGGSLKYFDGTVVRTLGVSGGSVSSITAGTGLTGGTITTAGTIALEPVGIGGTGTKITYDSFGRVTTSATLSETDLPNITTAGKVSGSAIDAGTIGGSASVNTTGTVTAATVTASTLGANTLNVYKTGNANKVSLTAPSGMSADYSLVLPAALGTANQVLATDASGNLSWVTPSGGTVTSVAATSPLASTGGATPTISIQQADATHDGFLSQADWTTFSNKMTNSLTSANVWVGNSSNVATGVTPSGDLTMSNTGAFTIANGAVTTTKINDAAITTAKLFTNPGANYLVATDATTGAGLAAVSCGAGELLTWSIGTGWGCTAQSALSVGSAVNFSGSLTGDVTGTQGATVVATVGTSTAANVHAAELLANAATNANTASTIVKRDASGNFIAGTATLTSGVVGNVVFKDTGTNTVTLQAPTAVSTSYTLRWPAATGASEAGKVLSTDASGNLSWVSSSVGSVTSVSASAPLISTGGSSPNISMPAADATHDGYLAQADWSTFNNKMSNTLASAKVFVGNASNVATGVALSGDATIDNAGALTVATVGGSTAANVHAAELLANAATNANTASAIVKRDASGNFAAGVVTQTSGVYKDGATNTVTVQAPSSVTTSYSLTWPAATGASDNGKVLSTNASGNLSWIGIPTSLPPSGAAGGDLSGTYPNPTVAAVGTSTAANVHAAEVLANAATDANTASAIVKRDASGNFTAGTVTLNSGVVGNVVYKDGASNTVTVQAPTTVTSSYTLKWPAATVAGDAGKVLSTDAAGQLSWVLPSVGSVTSVSGTSPIISSGGSTPAISIQKADATHDGYLAQADFLTFNGKLATALTSAKIFVGNASNVATGVALSGDATIDNAGALTVATVGTSTAANIHAAELLANAATALNTASAIVKRDASGNFVAGSASLGNAVLRDSATNTVTLQAPTTVTSSYTLKWPAATVAGDAGKVLSTDAAGQLSWIAPTAGSVTSVSAAAPLISTGGATPSISITKADATHDGYLAQADFTTFNSKLTSTLNSAKIFVGSGANVATEVAASGDVSLANTGAFTVTGLNGVGLVMSAPASGQFLKHNGTNWVNSAVAIADVTGLTTALGAKIDASQMPASCAANQTLTFSSPTGTWACSSIAITGSAFGSQSQNLVLAAPNGSAGNPTFRAIVAADLPTSGVAAGTYKSLTVDTYGRVTSGTNPTTLAGYGITDAVANLGGSPGIQTGLDAAKPATPAAGTIYYATDSLKIYQFNSSAWVMIASAAGSGGTITALTGDVTASGTGSVAATVAAVGGSTAANVHAAELLANAATDTNTVSTIVKRDASGNFAASAVTQTSSVYKDGGTKTVTLQAPTTVSTSYVLKLPPAVAALSGQVLASDTSGNLSWATALSGSSLTGISSIANATGNITLSPQVTTGAVLIDSGTPSTGTSNGALVVTGGVGVSGAVNAGGAISTAGSLSANGHISAIAATSATGGANYSSPSFKLSANYWDGAATAADIWQITNTLGSGTNPSATLTFDRGSTYSSGARRYAFLNGNVGIGTSSPNRLLEVAGPMRMIASTLPGSPLTGDIAIDSADANKLKWYNGTGWQTVGTGTGSGDFKADGSVAMTGALTALPGTAAAPGYAFNGDTNTGISAYTTDQLSFSTGGVERVTIDSNGRVGIGVSSPPDELTVAGVGHFEVTASSQAPLLILNNSQNTAGYGTQIDFGTISTLASVGYVRGASTTDGILNFKTKNATDGNVERMRIDSSGRVGIGTSSPNRLLEVAGPMRMVASTLPGSPLTGDIAIDSADSNKLKWYNGTAWQTASTGAGLGDFMKDGSVAMTGALKAASGTVGAPSMTFSGDSTTGLYFVTSGAMGVAAGGTQAMTLTSTAATVPLATASTGSASGALVVTGGVGVGGAVYTGGSVNSGSSVTAIGNITASGSAARTLGMTRNATAATAGQGLTVDAGGAIAGTADLNGGDLTLKSGIATGTGSSNIYFQTATAGASAVTDRAPSTKMTILGSGNVGIGTSSPTAALTLKAGTATSGTAPLKLTAGTNLTTPEAGAIEFDGTNLYYTDSTNTRKTLGTGTGSGDFKADGSVAMTGALQAAAGTAALPGYTFSGDTNTGISAYTADQLSFSTAGTERVTITSLGRVGIGTSSPAVSIDARATVSNGGMIRLQNNATNGYASTDLFDSTGSQVGGFGYGNSSAGVYPGKLYYYSVAKDLVFGKSAGGYHMVLQGSTGNVGIGTTSPTAVLMLKAGTATSGTAPLKLTAGTNLTTPEAGAIEFDGTNLYYTDSTNTRRTVGTGSGAGDFKADGSVAMTGALQAAAGTAALPGYTFSGDTNTGISAYTADQLSFSTAGSERVTIDSSGRVGIGISAPSLNLGLNGTSAQTFGMEANAAGAVGNQFTVKAGGSGAGTDLAGGDLYLASGGSTGSGGSNIYLQATSNGGGSGVSARTPSTRMVIMGAGQVSLGSSPAISHTSNLTVVGKQGSVPYQQALMLYRETNTAGDNQNFIFGFKNSGGTGPFNYAQIQGGITSNTSGSHTGYLSFSTANSGSLTEAARILSSGYVGIGTSVPSYPLQVSGTANATTFLMNGSSSAAAAKVTNATESVAVSATAATGTVNFYVASGAVQYYTSNAAANWTLNWAWSSGSTLNSVLAVGESVTTSFMVTQGATPYYPNAFTIDGSAVTPKWQGGFAPTAGNASSIDVYTCTIIKTAATPTYTVLCAATQYQ